MEMYAVYAVQEWKDVMEHCIFSSYVLCDFTYLKGLADINLVVAKVMTMCRNCFPFFVFTYFHQNDASLSGMCSWYVGLFFLYGGSFTNSDMFRVK
jgi:hypothetical protein